MAVQKNLLPDFLEAYKELETTIRANADNLTRLPWLDGYSKYSNGVSVLDVENGITDEDMKDKLKTCRIIRNYAQHHDGADGFIAATPAMVDFIKGMTAEIRLLNGTYKDCMTKCSVVLTSASNVSDCAAVFVKTGSDWYPVSDVPGGKLGMSMGGPLKGIITKDAVFAMLGAGSTLKTHIKDRVVSAEKSKVLVVKQTDPIPAGGIPKGRKIVVVNAKDKIVGIIG